MGERCACERCVDDVKSSTRTKYDAQWAAHDERAAADRRQSLAVVSDPLLRTLMPFAGKTVVDLGAGTGGFAFRAAELSPPARVIGVDFSAIGLSVARATSCGSRFRDMDFEFVLGDLERLPLAGKCADVILSQATFNLLPDKRKGMREMARIMAEERGATFHVPPVTLCVDNGAMIAVLGAMMLGAGATTPVEASGVRQRFRTDEVEVTWR